jgi:hypothetical protein
MSALLLDRLLRSPREIAEDCREERGTGAIAQTSLIVIALGAAVFGAVVGSWNGGRQVAFAALKLPMVSIATLALCGPAFFALAQVFGRPWPLRAVVSFMLAAGARLSLVLLASAPVLWLTINLGASYDLVKVLAALVYALAGLASVTLLVHGLGKEKGRATILALFVGIFLLAGGQTAWVLRPYIGMHDRSADISFFTREREGGLAYQLYLSATRLARGERSEPRGSSYP